MKKFYEKIVRRISRRFWNYTVHSIVIEAMKKNIINSIQCHAILGAWNANCFPEHGHRSFLHKDGRTPYTLESAFPSGHSGSSLECMHPFCVAERSAQDEESVACNCGDESKDV